MMRPLSGALAALAVAACSSNSALPRTPGGNPVPAKVTIHFHVKIPSAKRARRSHADPRVLRRWSIAQSTMSIKVVSYANGDRTTPLGVAVADISAANTPGNGCVNDSNGDGGRSCSLTLQSPPGKDDFVATTYDQLPAPGGTIPSGANQLGYGVTTQTIVAGTPAVLSLAVEGVVTNLTLALTPNTLHTLIPSSATLSVYATDADGDVIVTNGYIDANGNTINVALSLSNTLPLSGSSAASLTLSQSSISAPPPSGIAVKYAPPANGIVAPSNATVTVSASPSASSVTVSNATLTAVAPSFSSVADSNLNAANPYHGGIAFDALYTQGDNVYFTAPNGFGSIEECQHCTVAAPAVGTSAGTVTAPIQGGIAGNGLGFYSPAQSTVIYAIAGTTAETIPNGPAQTPIGGAVAASAPDGSAMVYQSATHAVWYTSGTNLSEYFASGAASPPPVPLGVSPAAGVSIDTGANIWVVDPAHNTLIECPATCTSASTLHTFALNSGGSPFDVVAFGTNAIVTDHQAANPAVLEVNASGSVVQTLALPSGATPWYVSADSAQPGVFWFDYLSSGQIGVARMDANVTPPTFLMATAPNASLSHCTPVAGAQAGAIAPGVTGTIYAVFDKNSCLMRVQR